jgi:hypothetical protein
MIGHTWTVITLIAPGGSSRRDWTAVVPLSECPTPGRADLLGRDLLVCALQRGQQLAEAPRPPQTGCSGG